MNSLEGMFHVNLPGAFPSLNSFPIHPVLQGTSVLPNGGARGEGGEGSSDFSVGGGVVVVPRGGGNPRQG